MHLGLVVRRGGIPRGRGHRGAIGVACAALGLLLSAVALIAPQAALATKGPVASYAFDEGSGVTAHDSAGSHNGTIHGAKWTKEGKYGDALEFDGENDILTIPSSPELEFSEAFTVEAWVRPQESKQFEAILTKETPSFFSYTLEAGGWEAGVPEGIISPEGSVEKGIKASEELPTKAWSHLALTYEGENLRLYVNGVLVKSTAEPSPQGGEGPLQIGGTKVFGEYFKGRIDEVSLYDWRLSAEEIAEDKETPIEAVSAPEPKPVAAYSFDEGKGEIAHDSIGKHNATIHGAKWNKEGKYDSALEFDGENDRVTIPDSEDLNFTEGFTLETWVRPSEAKEWTALIAKEDRSEEVVTPYSYLLFAEGEERPTAFIRKPSSGHQGIYGKEPLPINSWSYLALTDNGEEMNLFVDGELVSTQSSPPISAAEGPLQIAGNEVNGEYFKGRIDEIRLYDEPLGEAEIGKDGETAVEAPRDLEPTASYSFDEGIGETAYDSAGAHNGTIHGAKWTKEGKYGGALEFDGENDILTIPSSPELEFSEAFTLETWVRPQDSRKFGAIITKETPSFFSYALEAGGFTAGVPEGALSPEGSVEKLIGASEELPLNAWAHLALTYDGEQMRLYVNGELVKTVVSPGPQGGEGPLQIGGTKLFGDYFNGDIDEVRLYGEVLGSEEIESPQKRQGPSIKGKPEETWTLTADPGTWEGEEPIELAYQWERCKTPEAECTEIGGATEPTYEIASADLTMHLRVSVHATNKAGEADATSNTTKAITKSAPWFSSEPSFAGTPEEGSELKIDLSKLHGSKPQVLTYTWERCYITCSPISGATTSTYTLTAADTGMIVRAQVTAANEEGKASSAVSPTKFVKSVKTKGAPTVSEPPLLGGLPSATDEIASTEGAWAGAAPITTEVQWQRCNGKGESCEDIPEATEQSYSLTTEDVGSRLRTKVAATNGEGTTYELSNVTPEILPATNTVLIFSEPMPLEEVASAVAESKAKWLSFAVSGETSGYFPVHGKATGVVEAVSSIAGEDAPELPVVSIELSDSVPTEALGGLSETVKLHEEVPSIHEKSVEPPVTTDSFAKGAVGASELIGLADTDESTSVLGPIPVAPGMERALYSRFTWRDTPEETMQLEEEVGSDLAMEFDVKEHNSDNFNPEIEIEEIGGHPFCLPWEEDNFWLGTREPLFIESTIPAEAGLYWDTGASDPCSTKDLTYGLFHPDALEEGEPYITLVYFNEVFEGLFGGSAAGDTETSQITWGIQILGEQCDFSAWCVNLPGSVQGGEDPLIGESDLLERQWPFYPGPIPGPALFPGCYEFRNPQYSVSPPYKAGVGGCLVIS